MKGIMNKFALMMMIFSGLVMFSACSDSNGSEGGDDGGNDGGQNTDLPMNSEQQKEYIETVANELMGEMPASDFEGISQFCEDFGGIAGGDVDDWIDDAVNGDRADEKNWYQFFVRRGTGTGQFFAAYLGSMDDAVVNGTADYTVYNRSDIREKEGSPYFKTGEEVAVRLSQVDSLSYLFWDDYTKTVSSSSNLFFAPYSSIRSNVTGAAGYWCGMNSRTVRLIINN